MPAPLIFVAVIIGGALMGVLGALLNQQRFGKAPIAQNQVPEDEREPVEAMG